MVGRSPTPTKAQKRKLDLVSQLPCLACQFEGIRQPFPTEIDHQVHNGYRRLSGGHDSIVPLDSWHHRGVCLPGMNAEQMRLLYGPSKALHGKQFSTRYGRPEELLAATNAKIARMVV